MANHKIIAKITSFTSLFLFSSILSGLPAMAQVEIFTANNKDIKSTKITSLMSAVVDGDIDGVKFFIKSSVSGINQKNLGGATALHLACRTGNLKIAELLIENGADVNAVDAEGWTPLMRASLMQNAEIVNLLLSKNASVTSLNKFKDSAVVHAAESECNECLDLIFTKSDFIKNADIKVVKDQLNKAFVISKKQDNKISQDLLSFALDAAIKVQSLPVEDIAKKEIDHGVENTSKKEVLIANSEEEVLVDLSSSLSDDDQTKKIVPLSEPSSDDQIKKIVPLSDEEKTTPSLVEKEESIFSKIFGFLRKNKDSDNHILKENNNKTSAESILTEKDIPPVIVAKIESKQLSTAPTGDNKKSKKFKFNKGPVVAKPDLLIPEPPVVTQDLSSNEEESGAELASSEQILLEDDKEKKETSEVKALPSESKEVIPSESKEVVSLEAKENTWERDDVVEIETPSANLKVDPIKEPVRKKFKFKRGPVASTVDRKEVMPSLNSEEIVSMQDNKVEEGVSIQEQKNNKESIFSKFLGLFRSSKIASEQQMGEAVHEEEAASEMPKVKKFKLKVGK